MNTYPNSMYVYDNTTYYNYTQPNQYVQYVKPIPGTNNVLKINPHPIDIIFTNVMNKKYTRKL